MKLFALEKDEVDINDTNDVEMNLLINDKELEEAIGQVEQAKVAIEELNLLTQSLLDKKVSLEYAVMQIDHIYSRIGLKSVNTSVAVENINDLPYDVVLEDVLDTIKRGISRIANGFIGIDDFISNKLAVAIRNLKAAIGGIESSIVKTEGMVNSVPEKANGIFGIRKNISYELQTKNGKMLDFKATEEIITNHISILENFNRHKELISELNKYDLDEYRELLEKALKDDLTEKEKSSFTQKQKEQVEELRKIYKTFKGFVGKPLGRGKSLYIQFDEKVADRFVYYKDVFQFNIVTLLGMEPPKEAKQLNQREAKELAKYLRDLKELYLRTEDFIANITFIRQKRLKAYFGAGLFATIGAAIPSTGIGFISFIFSIIHGLLFYYYSILIVIRELGVTSTSLCYNVIKGTTRYIERSAKA